MSQKIETLIIGGGQAGLATKVLANIGRYGGIKCAHVGLVFSKMT